MNAGLEGTGYVSAPRSGDEPGPAPALTDADMSAPRSGDEPVREKLDAARAAVRPAQRG